MEAETSTAHTVYLVCALAGTLFFLLRIGMSLIGGWADGGDGAHDGGGHGHSDVTGDETLQSYRVFSSYSLSAFAMTFGWAGLAFSEQLKLGDMVSLGAALAVGFTMMMFTALSFHGMKRLTTTGSVFSLDQLPGKTGTVYERIPTGGTGVIQVTVEGILREVKAISTDGKGIDSFTQVKVERVVDGAVVSVRPLSAQ